jgi:hypothetical protein
MATTAIVFIGHSKERIIESIRSVRSYSFDKIILVVGDQESASELRARLIAEELSVDLATFFDVGTMQIDRKDVMRAAHQITARIRFEQAKGRDVLLNMSGSLRTFSFAAYIAGCITRSKMITAIPKYDRMDNEVGIEEVIDLPALPLNMPRDEQLRILAALGADRSDAPAPSRKKRAAGPPVPKSRSGGVTPLDEQIRILAALGGDRNNTTAASRTKKAAVTPETTDRTGGVASLDELVLLLNPKIRKGSDAFATERSRLSHHLKNFEMMGLVTKTKTGKNVGVQLTGLGEMFV